MRIVLGVGVLLAYQIVVGCHDMLVGAFHDRSSLARWTDAAFFLFLLYVIGLGVEYLEKEARR